MKMQIRLMVKPLCWEEVRVFFMRRPWARQYIGEQEFDLIKNRDVKRLSGRFLQDVSVFIAGYQAGRR